MSSSTAAHHVGAPVWVADGGDHDRAGSAISAARPNRAARWVRGTVAALQGPDLVVEVEDGRRLVVPPEACPLQNTRDDALDDLTRADFLHEPG